MKETVGASPYGGDLNKWPSRIVDAFVLLQDEHSRVDNMRNSRQSQQQNPKQTRSGQGTRRS
jgi:hypothetical protein